MAQVAVAPAMVGAWIVVKLNPVAVVIAVAPVMLAVLAAKLIPFQVALVAEAMV